MKDSQDQYLQLALNEIQADTNYIKVRIDKNEDYAHHINKRLQVAENKISYMQGGFYVFVAVMSTLIGIKIIF